MRHIPLLANRAITAAETTFDKVCDSVVRASVASLSLVEDADLGPDFWYAAKRGCANDRAWGWISFVVDADALKQVAVRLEVEKVASGFRFHVGLVLAYAFTAAGLHDVEASDRLKAWAEAQLADDEANPATAYAPFKARNKGAHRVVSDMVLNLSEAYNGSFPSDDDDIVAADVAEADRVPTLAEEYAATDIRDLPALVARCAAEGRTEELRAAMAASFEDAQDVLFGTGKAYDPAAYEPDPEDQPSNARRPAPEQTAAERAEVDERTDVLGHFGARKRALQEEVSRTADLRAELIENKLEREAFDRVRLDETTAEPSYIVGAQCRVMRLDVSGFGPDADRKRLFRVVVDHDVVEVTTLDHATSEIRDRRGFVPELFLSSPTACLELCDLWAVDPVAAAALVA